MNKKNSVADKGAIPALEGLLIESRKLKVNLEKCAGDGDYYFFRNVAKEYVGWLLKAGRIVGIKYKALIYYHIRDKIPLLKYGRSEHIVKSKAAMLGDVICIEDDIRGQLINLKKQAGKGSHVIREFIIKEFASNKELIGMLKNILSGKIGSMARYINEHENARGEAGYPDLKYFSSDPDRVKHLYEIHIKNRLKEAIGNTTIKKFNDVDFDIAYLEAKDELGEGVKERTKGRAKHEKAVEDSSLEYELISSGKKKKLLTSQKAEQIRNRKGTGIKQEIFIDDERKEVFFNRKNADGFRGQNYAFLVHFVENEGMGGTPEYIYNNVWSGGDPSKEALDNAVEQAISRLRALLKKYDIGAIPSVSKNMYDMSKAYIMKPKPRYCILRKIKKEKNH